MAQLYDPRTKALVDIVDLSAQAAAVTAANPVSKAVVEMLKKSRREGFGILAKLAALKHSGTDARLGFVAAIVSVIATVIAKVFAPPAKVAAGTILGTPILKFGFDTETTMYWYAVAPRTLGGSSKNLIFLTSSNQAGAGPEGLVAYENNLEAVFCVAENSGQIVRSIPYSEQMYKDHVITLQINGTKYSTLYIAIRTLGGGTTWTNEVLLYNPGSLRFDSMWKSDPFSWDPSKSGSRIWGPIIEITSAATYGQTNTIGFADARIVVDKSGKRIEWLLDGTNSDLGVNKEFEFDIRFQDANHTMLAD